MKKIREIEGLRGFLALWVVVSHVLEAAGLGWQWKGPQAALAHGDNAVAVFIVVSGFVIMLLLDTTQETYKQFIGGRALRLYPTYLVCLLAALPLQRLELAVIENTPWPNPLNQELMSIARDSIVFFPEHLAAHLVMMHSLFPDWSLPHSAYALLGPAWSLSLEWQFYIIAPFILLVLRQGRAATVILSLTAFVAYLILPSKQRMLAFHIPIFAVGIASYFVWRLRRRSGIIVVFTLFLFLIAFGARSVPLFIWSTAFMSFGQPKWFPSQVVSRVLACRVALFLGRMSYSTYLSHFIVLILSMKFLESLRSPPLSHVEFFLALFVLTWGGALLCSVALNRFVEGPFMSIGRQYRADRKAEPVTLGGHTP